MDHDDTDVEQVIESLREKGVDVVRVSYSDLIGIDRGRDVLIDELRNCVKHGIAFCRSVYHTTPIGSVVEIEGGLDAGLPDIHVRPDFSTLTPMPWEQGTMWCIGEAHLPEGDLAPESPRNVVQRVEGLLSSLGVSAVIGPELEFFVLEPDDSPTGFRRYSDATGNVYVVGRKGDPDGLLLKMLRNLRDAGLQVTAANHEFAGGQFEINLNHSGMLDSADRAFRSEVSRAGDHALREQARHLHGQTFRR
ncbi:MAG: hypothetical protein V9G09_05010 [Candidatus Nanopelagicales bacterium]